MVILDSGGDEYFMRTLIVVLIIVVVIAIIVLLFYKPHPPKDMISQQRKIKIKNRGQIIRNHIISLTLMTYRQNEINW